VRLLVPTVIGVMSLAVAGGLLARELYQERAPVRADIPVTVAPSTSLAPSDQPGSAQVKLTPDAARHPYGEIARKLLQAYTTGINERNYGRWKTAVSQERIAVQPKQAWLEGYRSTRIGSAVLHRIETGPDGSLRILFSFTSTQDEQDAPPDLPAGCIHWQLMLPLVLENDGWKIGSVVPGTVPEARRC